MYDPSMEGVFFLQLKLDASLFGFGRRNRQWLAQGVGRIAPAARGRPSRRPALLVCYRWANCWKPPPRSNAYDPSTRNDR